MKGLSGNIAKWCIKNSDLKNEQLGIIQFGIEVFMDSFFKIAGLIILGALFGFLGKVIIVLIVFCTIRYFAGGMHCESHIGCFLSMAMICIAAISLSMISHYLPAWLIGVILILAFINTLRYAPVISWKNPINDQKIIDFKKKGSLLCILIVSIFIIAHKDIAVKWLLVTPLFIEAITISPLLNKTRRIINEKTNYETEIS